MLHTLDQAFFSDGSAAFENQLFDALTRIHDIMACKFSARTIIDLSNSSVEEERKRTQKAEGEAHFAVLEGVLLLDGFRPCPGMGKHHRLDVEPTARIYMPEALLPTITPSTGPLVW